MPLYVDITRRLRYDKAVDRYIGTGYAGYAEATRYYCHY